jgi:hypothetical protein
MRVARKSPRLSTQLTTVIENCFGRLGYT